MEKIHITESELRNKIEKHVREKLNEGAERMMELTALGGLLRTTIWNEIKDNQVLGGKITANEFSTMMKSVYDGLAGRGYIVENSMQQNGLPNRQGLFTNDTGNISIGRQLNSQQMSDPFGWLQSQGADVRAILRKMNYDDRMIDCLLMNKCPRPEMQQSFDRQRQMIGQQAVREYMKWASEQQPANINESRIRQIVSESFEKALKDLKHI